MTPHADVSFSSDVPAASKAPGGTTKARKDEQESGEPQNFAPTRPWGKEYDIYLPTTMTFWKLMSWNVLKHVKVA